MVRMHVLGCEIVTHLKIVVSLVQSYPEGNVQAVKLLQEYPDLVLPNSKLFTSDISLLVPKQVTHIAKFSQLILL